MNRLIIIFLSFICCINCLFAQTMVFKPTSATIKDSQGSYTSQQFDCTSMLIEDNQTSVQVAIAGDKITLYPSKYNKDTYMTVVNQGSVEVTVVAFRSSSTKKIFLVTTTTRNGNKSVTIKFKP